MRTMQIEDIWARRDNGEPDPAQEDEVTSYTRLTHLRGQMIDDGPVSHAEYRRRNR